jgi:hypothetical protein
MDVKLNQYRKAVSAGGEMTRKRTVNNLRGIAMAALLSYFPRLRDQLCLVHLAGARGSPGGPRLGRAARDRPGLRRHPGEHGEGADLQPALRGATRSTMVQGGQQLGAIDSTDILKLEHIDSMRQYIDDLESRCSR